MYVVGYVRGGVKHFLADVESNSIIREDKLTFTDKVNRAYPYKRFDDAEVESNTYMPFGLEVFHVSEDEKVQQLTHSKKEEE